MANPKSVKGNDICSWFPPLHLIPKYTGNQYCVWHIDPQNHVVRKKSWGCREGETYLTLFTHLSICFLFVCAHNIKGFFFYSWIKWIFVPNGGCFPLVITSLHVLPWHHRGQGKWKPMERQREMPKQRQSTSMGQKAEKWDEIESGIANKTPHEKVPKPVMQHTSQ